MTASAPREHAIIVGGGLAGALLAIELGQAGFRVDVVERRPDPRTAGFIGGRSINLALSTRGITALERVGMAERVLERAVRMPGRMIHDADGHTVVQPYSKNPDDAINSVSRGGLNLQLLNAADECEQVTLHFNMRCMDVNLSNASVLLHNERTGGKDSISGDFIIGADGAFSAVRAAMMREVENFSYSQSFLAHGYKELSIPPDDDGGFRMEPNALHIWPRGGSMMIALPNHDGSFTCTLFWPFSGEHGFDAIRTPDDIRPFFERMYPDAVPLMPTLVEDYEHNPVSSLVTIRCAPWHHDGNALLVGDAAHAIVPFFGQGMNAAFEDVRILATMMREYTGDRASLFEQFTRERRDDANAIADMALANFIEMRDHTASWRFRLRKKAEQRLHAIAPRWFTPLYNMVSFSNIPYADALAKAAHQQRTLRVVAITFLAVLLVAVWVLTVIFL